MQAFVLLADSAQQDPAGKVHALGLGWSTTITPTPPSAVVVILKVPWAQTNQKHRLRLQLLDADGQPVNIGQDAQGQPVPMLVEGEFEVGRPAGIPAGMALDQSLAINIGAGLPLQAGQMFEWRLEINGHHEDEWSARFFVKS